MTQPPRRRAAEVVQGLGALLVLGVLLVGMPIGLYTVGGSPIPSRIPDWSRVSAILMRPDTDDQLFLGIVRLIGWAAWCLFAATTLAEALGHVAGRSVPSLPRPARPLQLLVRDLVATATLTFSTAAAFVNPASAAVHNSTAPHPHGPDNPATATPGPTHSDELGHTQVVTRGDTLWSIARRTYGSGALYPKIFKASRAIDQPDGLPALAHPDEIQPGQRIRLPQIGEQEPHHQRSRPQIGGSPEHADRTHSRVHDHAHPQGQASGRQRHTHETAAPTPIAHPPTSAPVTASASQQHSPKGDTPPRAQHHGSDNAPTAFTLPTGSRIGFGLAAVVSMAWAATRLHRRRRQPAADLRQGSAAPAPAPPVAVAKAHKAHLDSHADRGRPVPTDPDLVTRNYLAPPPDSVVLGTRDDQPVSLPLHGLNLGLTGDGAVPLARAVITEVLGQAQRYRAELVIPQADARALSPYLGTSVSDAELPGLVITPTLSAAVVHLEAALIHRARCMDATEQSDLPGLRAADPCEPLPTLLLVASAPSQGAQSLGPLVQLGRRYGIGSVILGAWPDGTSVQIAGDGTVTDAAGPHADHLAGAQLFHLTSTDTDGMLSTIHTATGACPPELTGTTPAPTTNHEDEAVLVQPPARSGQADEPPVRLQLLGAVQVHTADGPVATGLRRSARILLAYLALHPDGITRDQGAAALWPDEAPSSANAQFKTTIGNIRKILRTATGLTEPMFIILTGGRYQLDSNLIDVDLWRLSTGLQQARQAEDDTEHARAIDTVVDLYTADFADSLTHEWAANHREHLRRATINALARLAQRLQEEHPDKAIPALEHAIRLDPYAESHYRSLMKLEARLGNRDAVKRTYQLLSRHLGDLDTDPEPETHQLLTDLLRSRPR
jgi:DNA-binding SARP family transcriptional activator